MRATQSSRRGFTLLEVVVVTAIVAILVAIGMSAVGRAKMKGYVSDEIARQRQIYVAVTLYENDFDQATPTSLLDTTPNYLKAPFLTSPRDVRNSLQLASYPANPWSNAGLEQGLGYIAHRRTPEPNSYLFLPAQVAFFRRDASMAAYRQDPGRGFIAGIGLMACVPDGCMYWWEREPEMNLGQPAANLAGTMVVTRMDGSAVVREKPPCRLEGYPSVAEVFFWYPFCVETSNVSPL